MGGLEGRVALQQGDGGGATELCGVRKLRQRVADSANLVRKDFGRGFGGEPLQRFPPTVRIFGGVEFEDCGGLGLAFFDAGLDGVSGVQVGVGGGQVNYAR